MNLLDWSLMAIPLLLVAAIVRYSHRFTHSVADFISGGRSAERYLLAVASNNGAIVWVAVFEQLSKSGITLNWWNYFTPIVGLILGIYGFVSYRIRETRVLTLAQFFEIRYNKSFRVFAGVLGAFSGLMCDGIIAAVEARFFVYFLGLPKTLTVGSFTVDTYVPLMALFLGIALLISLGGGFVALMLIDSVEGMIAQVFFVLLIFTLLRMFSWTQITAVLGHRPPGESLFNPFDTAKVHDFNIWFVLMSLFVSTYTSGAWRNSNGQATAPLNAHEGRMAGLLGRWRDFGKGEVMLLLGICGLTFLAHPDFAAQARVAHAHVAGIAQTQIQGQMRIPIAISHFLPPLVKDCLVIILLMGMVAGTGTRTQSWASIVIQDMIVPLRRTAIPTGKHLTMLKTAIVGVIVFFFLFGALFRQTQYIIMWFSIAGAIYLGGAGSVIIGGLYWKKGTTHAAWASLLAGSTLAVGGILAHEKYQQAFPLNGVQVSFGASLIAIALYIVVSLLTCREDFDMDRMLHRGKYEVIKKLTGEETPEYKNPNWLLHLIGVDKDFSRGDKWIAVSLFVWMLFWLTVFLVGTIWNLVAPWPVAVWSTYWHVTAIGIPLVITIVTSVWFTWGGLRDMRRLFQRLKHEKINALDNGTVIGHRNAADLVLEREIRAQPVPMTRSAP